MLPEEDPDCFHRASDALPLLAALGRTELIVNGAAHPLRPKVLAVLLRLATADGEQVAADLLYRDVWQDGRQVGRDERTQVQKQIHEIRRVAGESVVETVTAGQRTAYRLRLGPDLIDFRKLRRLVEQAQMADATTAVTLLKEALALWRGEPLQDVGHLLFAGPVIAGLHELHRSAATELLRAHLVLGDDDRALAASVRLDHETLREAGLAEAVAALRARIHLRTRDLLRRTIEGPPAFTVSVVSGDLLTHRDAHLVVGFTDTFDTDTCADRVINSHSLQAEITRTLFDDDRRRLDRHLRAALEGVTPIGLESRAVKKHGKLRRYPVGTVAPIRAGERLVFGVAYSRMGNDLVAQSSLDGFTKSLERLWEAVYLHGQLRPIAVPLMGTGLSRIPGATPTDLTVRVVRSFVAYARNTRITTELRIVVRPRELSTINLREIADQLDQQG